MIVATFGMRIDPKIQKNPSNHTTIDVDRVSLRANKVLSNDGADEAKKLFFL